MLQSVSAVLAALKQCSVSKDVHRGKRLHEQAIHKGFISNAYVWTSLINMYAKCGCMLEASAVFQQQLHNNKARAMNNPAAWTCLIKGYVDTGQSQQALSLCDALQDAGCVADARIYVAALNACAALGSRCLQRGKRIHLQVLTRPCCVDVFVENALVDMYGKCGDMVLARLVFDSMLCCDVVAWTCLLHGYVDNGQSQQALQLFASMRNTCAPNRGAYVAALMACGSLAKQGFHDMNWLNMAAKSIHCQAVRSRCCDTFVEAALIDMYACFGDMSLARRVFDNMKENRNVVCWNALLQGYVENGECELAVELFDAMQKAVSPSARTFVTALTACGRLAGNVRLDKHGVTTERVLNKGKSIHAQAVTSCCCDTFVETALVDMYAKCKSMELARSVFDGIAQRNVVSWTALIRGYVENGASEIGLKLFHCMEVCLRDSRAYAAALTACASLGAAERENLRMNGAPNHACSRWLKECQALHAEAVVNGCCDSFLENTLIHVYAACGHMLLSRDVFDKMVTKSVVSWNALIQGYVDNGDNKVAFHLVASMDLCGATCDSVTFIASLTACGNTMALERGRLIHAEIVACCLENEAPVATSLLKFYVKCGKMDAARQVFDKMDPECKDCCAWNILIGGYSQRGDAVHVFKLVDEMKQADTSPDETSLTHVLAACSHAGSLTDKCKQYLNAMLSEHGINPRITHCNCLVDLLGRANCLDEAFKFIIEMPVEPNAATWTTLLAACTKWDNVALANVAFDKLLTLSPEYKGTASYVLMSHACKTI